VEGRAGRHVVSVPKLRRLPGRAARQAVSFRPNIELELET
jgi:hypothetical protein